MKICTIYRYTIDILMKYVIKNFRTTSDEQKEVLKETL